MAGAPMGREHRPMSEINVTPFVDVMLVLLIIFMVTAPHAAAGDRRRPARDHDAGRSSIQDEPLILVRDSQGRWQGVPGRVSEIPLEELRAEDRRPSSTAADRQGPIFLRADQDAPSTERVAKALAAARGTPVRPSIGMVTEPE